MEVEKNENNLQCQADEVLSLSPDDCPNDCPDLNSRNSKECDEVGTRGTTASVKSVTIETLTIHGMARRFANESRGQVFYTIDSKRYLSFESGRFSSNPIYIQRRVKKIIDTLPLEYGTGFSVVKDTDGNLIDLEDLKDFQMKMRTAGSINSILEVARSELGLEANEGDFDAHPHLLNCPNGIINLKNQTILEHCPEYRLTEMAGVDYDPEARSALWDHFVDTITRGDKELHRYLQTAAGYALTAETREHALFILHGKGGGEGKSTFLNAIGAALGSFAIKTPMRTLLQKAQGVENDIARLQGARLVSATEVNAEQRLDSAKVKELTGGDPIAARFLYREFFQFIPGFKLFIAVNDLPRVPSNDEALFRRIRVIPFHNRIAPEDVDNCLGSKLLEKENLKAVLAWMVEGAKRWYEKGLKTPTAVEAATNAYRKDSDFFGMFISERCSVGEGKKGIISDIYTEFQQWASNNGFGKFKENEIRSLITKKNFIQKKSGSTRYWDGIELKKFI